MNNNPLSSRIEVDSPIKWEDATINLTVDGVEHVMRCRFLVDELTGYYKPSEDPSAREDYIANSAQLRAALRKTGSVYMVCELQVISLEPSTPIVQEVSSGN